jgi:hypothetical protein
VKLRKLVWLGGLGSLSQGCYSLQPVKGVEPQVGTRVAFDVNDQGRIAVAGTMGPDIAQVEGLLLEKESGTYRLSVRSVRSLRGLEQVWSGEEVRLRADHLGPARERRFSAGRSMAFAAVGLGGIGAFVLSRSLLGSGTEDDGGTPCQMEPCTPDERLGRLGRP